MFLYALLISIHIEASKYTVDDSIFDVVTHQRNQRKRVLLILGWETPSATICFMFSAVGCDWLHRIRHSHALHRYYLPFALKDKWYPENEIQALFYPCGFFGVIILSRFHAKFSSFCVVSSKDFKYNPLKNCERGPRNAMPMWGFRIPRSVSMGLQIIFDFYQIAIIITIFNIFD